MQKLFEIMVPAYQPVQRADATPSPWPSSTFEKFEGALTSIAYGEAFVRMPNAIIAVKDGRFVRERVMVPYRFGGDDAMAGMAAIAAFDTFTGCKAIPLAEIGTMKVWDRDDANMSALG